MLAAWYDRQGPAGEVLQVGELPDPEPAAGEVRIRLTVSGVNPGDTKKRSGWLGNPMAFPRIVPHSDGAGIIDAVGARVAERRIGERVWVYGAQSYRPFGTAAQLTVVPDRQAVALPEEIGEEVGASLGIPGITAHRAVFSDGPVEAKHVLVHGVLGAVGSLAVQLARWGGAAVIGTVRRTADITKVDPAVMDSVVALDKPDAAAQVRALAPHGVDRIVEVSLSDNADFDTAVVGRSSDHRRIREPCRATGDTVLAAAVRQCDAAADRQRRLLTGGETASCPRSYEQCSSRSPPDRDCSTLPPVRDRAQPRRRRRRRPRPCVTGDSGVMTNQLVSRVVETFAASRPSSFPPILSWRPRHLDRSGTIRCCVLSSISDRCLPVGCASRFSFRGFMMPAVGSRRGR